jgi:hypothetical protein
MSCDGAIIGFSSSATNLVTGDTNGKSDVFIAERVGGTRLTNITISGNDYSGVSSGGISSGVSCDGNYMSFYSTATNIVTGDTNSNWDVFRYSRVSGQTELVSRDSSGSIGNGRSYGASLSGDGRYIAFWSASTNLVTSDTNGTEDIFIKDLNTGITEILSQNSSGVYGKYGSFNAIMSANGKKTVYSTASSNLVAGDTDTTGDVILSQTGY